MLLLLINPRFVYTRYIPRRFPLKKNMIIWDSDNHIKHYINNFLLTYIQWLLCVDSKTLFFHYIFRHLAILRNIFNFPPNFELIKHIKCYLVAITVKIEKKWCSVHAWSACTCVHILHVQTAFKIIKYMYTYLWALNLYIYTCEYPNVVNYFVQFRQLLFTEDVLKD